MQPEDLRVYPSPRYLQVELSTTRIFTLFLATRTVNSEPAVVFGIPVFVLLSGARSNDIPCVLHTSNSERAWYDKRHHATYLGIGLYLKPPRTQMTFTPERVDWCRVIIPDLLLLGVVSHAHSDMIIAGTTVHISGKNVGRNGDSMERTTIC